MKRYFVAQCNDEGEADGDITEILPSAFYFGRSILIGIAIGLALGMMF